MPAVIPLTYFLLTTYTTNAKFIFLFFKLQPASLFIKVFPKIDRWVCKQGVFAG